jgi:hypothetical protein
MKTGATKMKLRGAVPPRPPPSPAPFPPPPSQGRGAASAIGRVCRGGAVEGSRAYGHNPHLLARSAARGAGCTRDDAIATLRVAVHGIVLSLSEGLSVLI